MCGSDVGGGRSEAVGSGVGVTGDGTLSSSVVRCVAGDAVVTKSQDETATHGARRPSTSSSVTLSGFAVASATQQQLSGRR